MSDEPRSNEPRIPPPPSEHSLAIVRGVFALLGTAAFIGMWLVTDAVATPWRIVLCLLVAAPLLSMPNLLHDKSRPPPGFKPRKWEDED